MTPGQLLSLLGYPRHLGPYGPADLTDDGLARVRVEYERTLEDIDRGWSRENAKTVRARLAAVVEEMELREALRVFWKATDFGVEYPAEFWAQFDTDYGYGEAVFRLGNGVSPNYDLAFLLDLERHERGETSALIWSGGEAR